MLDAQKYDVAKKKFAGLKILVQNVIFLSSYDVNYVDTGKK